MSCKFCAGTTASQAIPQWTNSDLAIHWDLKPMISATQCSIHIHGYWHQRADERHDNPPQGNQELLVVRDKVGRPSGELK